MEDFFKTVKAQLYERVSSPLMFSFCVSWIAWNARLILVAISSMDPEKKFDLIDATLYENGWIWLGRCVIGPLVTALIYIYLYPFPARAVYRYNREQQRALKKIQQEIDDETPLTKEEAKEIRDNVRKVTAQFESQLEQRDATIARLKSEVADLNELIEKSQPVTPDPSETDALNDRQQRLLKEIASSTKPVSEDMILTLAGEHRLKAQHNLDVLLKRKMIAREFSSDLGGYSYIGTERGRAYLVERSQ
ncbi:hypothetical protein [Janthinobacterium sp. NKUCC06_STL]|uniref:hypothetical protein n=1 Tax=Janthinobacterium sp. NKUCC06_STL TaxID=2842127 RepID=UPI001C5A7A94|nr:hypothetical protein [Janthinobacterium sp. NKUCC06_STL]MBW3510623.1 hypothetical protein [Janthinobacterium sp. NKUCC06_STL]